MGQGNIHVLEIVYTAHVLTQLPPPPQPMQSVPFALCSAPTMVCHTGPTLSVQRPLAHLQKQSHQLGLVNSRLFS